MTELESLRYPIGRFAPPSGAAAVDLRAHVEELERFPADLRAVVGHLAPERLETPYRPGGWSVRQVVHHLADSHLNAFVRWKLALTEDQPTVKTYEEARWAETADAMRGAIEPSLALLDGLHARCGRLLRGLEVSDWRRTFLHPETGVVRLDASVALYAWHGRHHLAQITALAERSGWGLGDGA